MDPLIVLKTLWHHKVFVLPVVLLAILAGAYVYAFGPRSYESNMSYAIVSPKLPTVADIAKNPKLEELNKDNPYLRSSDPALISDVLIMRLNSVSTADQLAKIGLDQEHSASRGGGGNGFVIEIRGTGKTSEQSIDVTKTLGSILESDLKSVQAVSGADQTYFFTAIIISTPERATEMFSDRLRSVIVVELAGVIVIFGAVSLARALEARRRRRPSRARKDSGRRTARARLSDSDSTVPPTLPEASLTSAGSRGASSPD